MNWSEKDFEATAKLVEGLLNHRGFLNKKGEKNAQWKRRYFTLGQESETG